MSFHASILCIIKWHCNFTDVLLPLRWCCYISGVELPLSLVAPCNFKHATATFWVALSYYYCFTFTSWCCLLSSQVSYNTLWCGSISFDVPHCHLLKVTSGVQMLLTEVAHVISGVTLSFTWVTSCCLNCHIATCIGGFVSFYVTHCYSLGLLHIIPGIPLLPIGGALCNFRNLTATNLCGSVWYPMSHYGSFGWLYVDPGVLQALIVVALYHL